MSFAKSFRNGTNMTTTENGAPVRSTTGSSVLNLFARIGGLRNADENELVRLYLDARNENAELADNIILYARDIRAGGLGERRIARILLKALAKADSAKVARNFDTIVTAGRWDDLFVLEGTSLEKPAFEFIKNQFQNDIINMNAGKNISLLAKWLPSCNTSSAETRRLARKIYNYFGINERKYRKTLSTMRKYLDVVEKKMSANKFNSIDYEAVPSVAMTRYRSAFGRHDYERFNAYISAVTKGTAKINASVSYPYELIMPYVRTMGGWGYNNVPTVDPVLEAQWKALPNYVEGNHNVIVMADVSGSMTIDGYKPLATSTSLGIYFAERNTGEYKNLIMTFTDQPSLYEINPNDTLASKAAQVNSHVGYNTDLDLAFKKIYEIAQRAGEAPEALVIISDGEIDNYCYRLQNYGSREGVEGIAEKWQRIYADAGLVAPKLIMWNVESRGSRFIADKSNTGVSYISGSSAATFKELTTLITKDAVTAMIEILTKPQFSWK